MGKKIFSVFMWLYFAYMVFLLIGMAGIYLPIQIVLAIICCPLVFKFVNNRFEIKHDIIVRLVIVVVTFFITFNTIILSANIRVDRTIKPLVVQELEKEYNDYDEVEVLSIKYNELKPEKMTEYYEVTVEIIAKKGDETERETNKYRAVYDSVKRECLELTKH